MFRASQSEPLIRRVPECIEQMIVQYACYMIKEEDVRKQYKWVLREIRYIGYETGHWGNKKTITDISRHRRNSRARYFQEEYVEEIRSEYKRAKLAYSNDQYQISKTLVFKHVSRIPRGSLTA